MEIKDYPNYLIYEDGRVFSKKKQKFVTTRICNSGYLRVRLYANRKVKSLSIHRLIAIHYIPNPNKLEMVDHINRNKLDNRIENLRWVNRSTNSLNKSSKSLNIVKDNYGFRVHIQRNKLTYCKTKKTMEEAIVQRDLMLSMFYDIA